MIKILGVPEAKKYGTIIYDPPWPERGSGKVKRGADRHYPVMTVKEIIALRPIMQSFAAPDSHHYMWVTNNYLGAGFEVLKAWGIHYVTCITWNKIGKPGLGQYFRGTTEHVLFGRRGCPPYRVNNGRRGQGLTGFETFVGGCFSAERGKHSQKPPKIHEYAEIVSPGPYLEVFARSERKGWASWGNEAPATTKVKP